MKNIIILFCLFYIANAKLAGKDTCRNCVGKIHTKDDLKLTLQPLIIDKNSNCYDGKHKFLIIVKSGDFQRRHFTRTTWAKEITEQFNIPVLYAIGYPKNATTQKQILSEDEIYHDLLQFNIIESYYNLTLKTTSVLVWFNQHCSRRVDYLLYVDDDVLIHVDKLILFMHNINTTDSIQGWFETSGRIQRKGIGGVSKEDFPIDVVPDYLWGAAVLYPSKVLLESLINAIFNTTIPIFFRDDAFINGFIAEEAGIKRELMKGILSYDPTEDDLKKNMIIIDFKNEESRIKAWNCYRYGIQCNKNLLLTLFKIFGGLSLFIIIAGSLCRCFMKTIFYDQLRSESIKCIAEFYDFVLVYFDLSLIFRRRKQYSKIRIAYVLSFISSFLCFRKMYMKMGIIFIVIIVLYKILY